MDQLFNITINDFEQQLDDLDLLSGTGANGILSNINADYHPDDTKTCRDL